MDVPKPPERKESSTNWKSLHGLPSALRWLAGFSAYTKIEAKEASTVTETVMDTSAIDNYVSGLSSDAE